MDLIHDVLDAQLRDRDGRKIGRIDSIVIALDGDGPPRVVAAEVGPVALAARVHPRVAAWLSGWLRRRGSVLASPYRIEWAALRRVDNDFTIDADASSVPITAGEQWTREQFIGRIPGA